MGEGDSEGDVREKAMLNLLAGLPEAERARTLARLLDELERLHLESGASVPGWIEELRKRHAGGEVR